ncbi:MAG: hypothetical protein HQK60_13520, partial [Deltaproteobacteria bacterium]|nr:hypothetical protein [Deltaproteobacteria bacterium]
MKQKHSVDLSSNFGRSSEDALDQNLLGQIINGFLFRPLAHFDQWRPTFLTRPGYFLLHVLLFSLLYLEFGILLTYVYTIVVMYVVFPESEFLLLPIKTLSWVFFSYFLNLLVSGLIWSSIIIFPLSLVSVWQSGQPDRAKGLSPFFARGLLAIWYALIIYPTAVLFFIFIKWSFPLNYLLLGIQSAVLLQVIFIALGGFVGEERAILISRRIREILTRGLVIPILMLLFAFAIIQAEWTLWPLAPIRKVLVDSPWSSVKEMVHFLLGYAMFLAAVRYRLTYVLTLPYHYYKTRRFLNLLKNDPNTDIPDPLPLPMYQEDYCFGSVPLLEELVEECAKKPGWLEENLVNIVAHLYFRTNHQKTAGNILYQGVMVYGDLFAVLFLLMNNESGRRLLREDALGQITNRFRKNFKERADAVAQRKADIVQLWRNLVNAKYAWAVSVGFREVMITVLSELLSLSEKKSGPWESSSGVAAARFISLLHQGLSATTVDDLREFRYRRRDKTIFKQAKLMPQVELLDVLCDIGRDADFSASSKRPRDQLAHLDQALFRIDQV